MARVFIDARCHHCGSIGHKKFDCTERCRVGCKWCENPPTRRPPGVASQRNNANFSVANKEPISITTSSLPSASGTIQLTGNSMSVTRSQNIAPNNTATLLTTSLSSLMPQQLAQEGLGSSRLPFQENQITNQLIGVGGGERKPARSASPRKDNNNNSFEYSTSRGGGGYYREEAKSTSPNRYYYNNRSVATATADYDERYHARHPEQDFQYDSREQILSRTARSHSPSLLYNSNSRDRVYTDRSEGYLERDYNRPEYDYSLRRRQW
ncbi:3612_t:CDS:2 [Entrophospora sp. SA101]|nr:14913_t:CDS:2 [Entrophospora candida]CAJ0866388.1 3612_t:CDS:2 [Entrophospora sp. SA101]